MKVRIPTPLRSYTDQQTSVEGRREPRSTSCCATSTGPFPGMRFRIVDEQGRLRKHMKVFVNADSVRDLSTAIDASDEITIMQALSGG